MVDELHSLLLVHEKKVRHKKSKEKLLNVAHDSYSGHDRGRSNYPRGGGNNSRGRGRTKSGNDKATIECFRCHKMGHFQYECPSMKREANYDEFEYNEELLLMTQAKLEGDGNEGACFFYSS